MIVADATKPQDSDQLIFTGGEYTFGGFFSVRGGWKFNYSGTNDSKLNEFDGETISVARTEEGFSLGGGLIVPLKEKSLLLDYAYTEFGILDSVHRLSLAFSF
jgi:hypothetical protein